MEVRPSQEGIAEMEMRWLLFPGLILMFCSWCYLDPDGSRTRFVWWARRNRYGILFALVILSILVLSFFAQWFFLGP